MVIYSDSNLKQPNFKAGLYLISTPIGNLADISFRSLSALANLDEVFCEDPSQTIKILNHFQIKRPLKKFYEFSGDLEKIINALLAGKSVGIVSDAGTPAISDPGYEVVKEAVLRNIEVFSVAGPSALIAALSISGLPTERFFFAGFCPRKNKEREEVFAALTSYDATLIFYETAKRMKDSLLILQKYFPSKQVCLVKEVTKKYEAVVRGQIADILDFLQQEGLKGECVLLVDNNLALSASKEVQLDALQLIQAFKDDLPPAKLAAKISKLFALSKKEVYNLILEVS